MHMQFHYNCLATAGKPALLFLEKAVISSTLHQFAALILHIMLHCDTFPF